MTLGTLSLSVTSGVQGRPFAAQLNGLTTGKVEVISGGSEAGAPGFSTVNGMVRSEALPYPVSTVVVREYDPGGTPSFKDTRMAITATTAIGLVTLAAAAIAGGRILIRSWAAATKQSDGSLVWSGYAEDDYGSTVAFDVGGGVVAPVLGTLALSGTLTSGVSSSGTITGATTLSIITSNVTGLSVNSAARTYTFDGSATAATVTNGLVETLAGATGSPKNNSITIAAATITLGSLTLSGSLTNGTSSSGTITGASTSSAIVSNVTGLTVNSGARTYTFDGTATAATIANGLVETLAGATASPKNNSVVVGAAAGITAPVLTKTSGSGASPIAFTIAFDGTVAAGMYILMQRTNAQSGGVPNWADASLATEYRQLTMDDFTGTAAFNLITTAPTGYNAFRVQVDSDAPATSAFSNYVSDTLPSVSWAPDLASSAPVFWLDAQTTASLTLSGSAVTTWASRVGGTNAAQGTSGNRPAYSATAANSLPGVTFDGSNDYLQISSIAAFPAGSSASTIAMIGKNTGSSDGWILIFGSSGTSGRSIGKRASGGFTTYVESGSGGSIEQNNGVAFTGDGFGAAVEGSGASAPIGTTFNGGTLQAASTSGFTAGTGTALGLVGAFSDGSGPVGLYWQGVIQEIVVYGAALNTTERQKLEGYLAWRWGQQANLAVGHPYVSAAPTT